MCKPFYGLKTSVTMEAFDDELFGETTKTKYYDSNPYMYKETLSKLSETELEPWMDFIVQTLYYLIEQAKQKNKTMYVLDICIPKIINEIDKYSFDTYGSKHLNDFLSNIESIYEFFVSVSIFVEDKLRNRTSPCGMIFDSPPHFAMLVESLLPNNWCAKHWQEKKFSDFIQDHSRCRCQNYYNDIIDYNENTSSMDIYERMQYDNYMHSNRPSHPSNCWVRPNKKGNGAFAPEVTYKKQFRSSSKVILIMWRTNIDKYLGSVCSKMPKSLTNGTKYTIEIGQQKFLTAAKNCKKKLEIVVDIEQQPIHNLSILNYVKLAVIQYNHVQRIDFSH